MKIFSFIFQTILEEWKKLGKKIHKTWQKLWKYWKKLWKKLWKKKIFQSFKNIFFHFPKYIGKMEEARQKNSQDLAKTLEMLEE